MGNIGRSSTGCGLCRKRKIKCDEGKPGCRRCAQIRKPCPGYPFQIQLDIRSPPAPPVLCPPPQQSIPFVPYSQTYVRSPPIEYISQLSPSTIVESQEVKEEERTEVLLHVAPHYSPIPAPRYDVLHQSVCFFLHLFCYQAGRLYSFPVIDFLPDILRQSQPGSAIQLAAGAVSRMTLADQYSGTDVRLQTGTEYGKALVLTTQKIRDPSESIKDETVVAVWLLGLYELINAVLTHGRENPDRSPEEEWQSHISHVKGAMHLLKLRGNAQFTSPRSKKIFRVFKAAIQMRLFILNSVSPKDFNDLDLDIYKEEHEFVPSKSANKASAYFLKVARLVEYIKAHLFTRSSPALEFGSITEANKLIEYGESLDRDIENWSKDELGWDMMKIRASTTGTTWALCPAHALYYFYSFWVYLYWIRFLIARVKLYESLIELIKADLADMNELEDKARVISSEFRMSRYRTIIQMTAADVIGLTAYAIGDVSNTGVFEPCASGWNSGKDFQEINVVAAMQLVIPLKTLQRSDHTTAIQRAAIDLAILQIADGFRRQPMSYA